MAKPRLIVWLIFLLACPGFAGFTFLGSDSHNERSKLLQCDLSQPIISEVDEYSAGLENDDKAVDSANYESVADGYFPDGDFLLQPVSIMRLNQSLEVIPADNIGQSSADTCYLCCDYVSPNDLAADKLRVSRTPAPSAVVLGLFGVTLVGLLRRSKII